MRKPLLVAVCSFGVFLIACSGDDEGTSPVGGMGAGASPMSASGGVGGASGGAGGMSATGGMGSVAGAGGMTGGSGGMTGGSGGMTGGSGGMTGGTGGSGGMTGGTGMEDAEEPDPCDDVDDACDDEGIRCDGAQLVTCEENEDGCLVETRIDCDEGGTDFCDDSGASAECASCDDVDDACEAASVACDGETLVRCAADAHGCLVETQTDCTAGSNDYCDEDAATPACAACASLPNDCNAAGTSCSDATTLQTCAANADGCLVTTATDCTTVDDFNACDAEGIPDPKCYHDVCRNEDGVQKPHVCVEDEAQCAGDILITCEPDGDTCPIAVQTDCTTDGPNNYCDDTGPTAQCANDPCLGVTNCAEEGSHCEGPLIISCEETIDGCLVLHDPPHDCTVGGTVHETCDPTSEPHVCTPCDPAPRCDGVGVQDGDTSCNGNVFETCTDTDQDGCFDRLDEDCGDDFECDDEDGCVFDGPACVETIDEDRVLRDETSNGPFTTTGEVNDYSGFSMCPGLSALFPFAAGAPDLLFALDVPAQTVIEVAFDNPTGFTGSGAWMTLLESCAADGETTCSAISNESLEYANTGDTTVRVYLEVDADGAANVGMFGLGVTTRPLVCGDGELDGDEECDDGDIFEDDGCTPGCELEEGYECTDSSPSICTLRPDQDEPVCGNVACDPVPTSPTGIEACCTIDAKCGLAYPPYYGASCIAREPVRPTTGAAADMCPDEPGQGIFLFIAPTLNGCCREDETCGLTAGVGLGCVERGVAWTAIEDGPGSTYYEDFSNEVHCEN